MVKYSDFENEKIDRLNYELIKQRSDIEYFSIFSVRGNYIQSGKYLVIESLSMMPSGNYILIINKINGSCEIFTIRRK